jgi:hypothetical protein
MTELHPLLYVKFTKACTWCRREFPNGDNHYFVTDPDDSGQNEHPATEAEYKARRIREVLLYEETFIPTKKAI